MQAASSSNQIICSRCEETVHRFAARCPYCNYDLANAKTAKDPIASFVPPTSNKITPLEQPSYHRPEQLALPQEQQPTESEPSLFSTLIPLVSLIGGAFFVFFALMLKVFSKNGKLVLEWHADSWAYYFFPALFFLLVGIVTLSSADTE
jgi:hypothetical protein